MFYCFVSDLYFCTIFDKRLLALSTVLPAVVYNIAESFRYVVVQDHREKWIDSAHAVVESGTKKKAKRTA